MPRILFFSCVWAHASFPPFNSQVRIWAEYFEKTVPARRWRQRDSKWLQCPLLLLLSSSSIAIMLLLLLPLLLLLLLRLAWFGNWSESQICSKSLLVFPHLSWPFLWLLPLRPFLTASQVNNILPRSDRSRRILPPVVVVVILVVFGIVSFVPLTLGWECWRIYSPLSAASVLTIATFNRVYAELIITPLS